MLFIRRQYDGQERELDVRDDLVFDPRAIATSGSWSRSRASPASLVQAVNFGRTISRGSSPRAVFVTDDVEEGEHLRDGGSASSRACR